MSKVIIEKCADYSENNIRKALESIFHYLGGIEKYIKPGTRVALKPNLVMKKKPEEAVTTHPMLVKVLCQMITDAGGSIIIADSPGGIYSEKSLKGVYSACGMTDAALATGASLNYDLGQTDVDNPQGKFLKKLTVIKPLADADIIINLPKLKTHGQMVYTGAVKNMFGAVPGVLKAEYHLRMAHYDEFANALIDIFLSVKPALNIMDAVVGMDGYGPTAGSPKHIGLLAASEDAFSLDLTALLIIGAKPELVPIIRQALNRGLCKPNLDSTEILGEDIEKVRIHDFTMPQMDTLRAIEFYDNRVAGYFIKKLKPRPVFMHELCVGCGECGRNCPVQIIKMIDRKPKVELSKCIRCFCCQELCPAQAVKIKRPILVDFLLKNKKV